MKKLLGSCLLLAAGAAFAFETVKMPTLPAPGLVDGDLADACWKRAYATKPFTAIKPGDHITEETVAYVFCTADTLYIGAKCSFADYALREQIVNAKSTSGFTGDCIEMFIDPGDTGNYAHIAVNVAGNITAQGTVQPIKCCTQLCRTYWMMEAEIPFASIKLDAASYNANWRLNVARGNYKKGECSSWSKLENGVFGEPASFNALSGITADLVTIAKAQKAAARKDFEIALDHIVYTDQTEVKATLDFLHAKPITGFSVQATVADKDGKKVIGKSIPLKAFHADFAIPLKDFSDGKYVATLAVVDAAGKAVKSGEKTFYKIPPMRDSGNTEHFTIKDHCFYKNGKFFFPIITWALTSSGFKSLEDWRAASEIQLADLEEHGFNAGITGGYMFSEEDPDTMQKTKSLAAWHTKAFKGLHDAGVTFADHCRMAQKHGVAVIATSPYRPKSPFALDCFVDHVARIRKAPNVMVWHTADETDGQIEYNALLNQLYHEIDPTRLTWLNVINAVAANRNAADILATDPYPIPNGRVTAVAAHADRLVDNTKGRPQVGRWLWIQNFGGEGSWTRPPTPAEVKCMSMLAINHGVKGLAYFTYMGPSRRDGVRQHPEGMSLFKEFSPFLQKWTPALCQGKTVFQGRQGDLDVLAVTFEGRKVLSVVNVENKPLADAPVKIDGFCDKAFTLDGYGIAVEELTATHPAASKDTAAFERLAVSADAMPPEMCPADPKRYSTNHLAFALNNGLGMTRGGRIWASWIAGEDGSGAFTVANWSDDGGETWSDVKFVIDGHDGKTPERTNIIGTFWLDPDGKFRCYTDQSVRHFDGRAGVWELVCENPDDAHPRWSKPRRICNGHVLNKPIVLSNGDWAMTCYLNGTWADKGSFPGAFASLDGERGATCLVSTDRGRTWEQRATVAFPTTSGGMMDWQESQLVELKDGTLRLFARVIDGKTGCLMAADSKDGGRTFSSPRRLKTMDNTNARFQIQRLKSGRLIFVKHGTPTEYASSYTGRHRLTAYLSDDDGATWKGGLLLHAGDGSYPDLFQAPDGLIYVTHDHDRGGKLEPADIYLHRFTEEDVLAKRIVSERGRLGILVSRAMASPCLAARDPLKSRDAP